MWDIGNYPHCNLKAKDHAGCAGGNVHPNRCRFLGTIGRQRGRQTDPSESDL